MRIPVTSPTQTLIDLASPLDRMTVERMINEADRLGPGHAPGAAAGLAHHRGQPGVARLRRCSTGAPSGLPARSLERLFLPLAKDVGLPVPETKVWVNGFEVDFYWPDLRLVVETDGLRYHRTPAEQAGTAARPGPHRRRLDAAALHPRAGPLRAGPRARRAGATVARLLERAAEASRRQAAA